MKHNLRGGVRWRDSASCAGSGEGFVLRGLEKNTSVRTQNAAYMARQRGGVDQYAAARLAERRPICQKRGDNHQMDRGTPWSRQTTTTWRGLPPLGPRELL